MDLASILLILTVLILTAAFVVRPLFEKMSRKNRSKGDQTNQEHLRSSLLAEKERALNSLQELDFDHSLHKIPEELYPEQRSVLMNQAAGILKQLEELGVPQGTQMSKPASTPTGAQAGYDELEELIAKRKGEIKVRSGGFCPHCGKPVSESDRFCPKCGATIHPG